MESLTIWHFGVIGIGIVCVLCLALLVALMFRLQNLKHETAVAVQSREALLEKMQQSFRLETELLRKEITDTAAASRRELNSYQTSFGGQLTSYLNHNAEFAKGQLDSFSKQLSELTGLNEVKFDNIKTSIEQNLTSLRQNNDVKLDEMRKIVDEKLQTTLDQRLGAQFKQVSDQLEQVYKGLGEMQTLAAGVGDLKNILTNVKVRGTWGEIRLGHILEQILTREQYAANVCVKPDSAERVEFAVCLPGNDEHGQAPVYLPIDSKFPQEDYMVLQKAQQNADTAGCEAALKSLRATILNEARNISTKYIMPPHTTDFAIMFLPTEGLYAEILNIPGVCEDLQNKYRVIVAGPTTLAALLNSLQMGFRTLAIQKRSSEVWQVLGAVKSEFDKFAGILDKLERQLATANKTLTDARKKTSTIGVKLRKVEILPNGGDNDEDPADLDEACDPTLGEPVTEADKVAHQLFPDVLEDDIQIDKDML